MIFRGELAVSFREGISLGRNIDIIPDYYPWDPCMVYILTFGAISVVNVGKQMYHTWSSRDPLPNKWDDHPV